MTDTQMLVPRQPTTPTVASPARAPVPVRPSVLVVAGNVCMGVFVLVALFAGYLGGLSPILQARSQHELGADLVHGAAGTAFAGRLPAEGHAVGVLTIPSIGLHTLLVEGTSAGDLEKGPGLLEGSAPPGTGGDTVIEGRRTTFGAPFARVPGLSPGTDIEVVGALGRFHYVVTGATELSPGAADPLTAAPAGQLTLVTSAPRWLPTRAAVVQARLVGAPVAADPGAPPPDTSLGLAGDSGALTGVIVSGELLVALVVALVVRRRRHGLPRMAYVLATPVALMLLLVLFAESARLLPATM